MPAARLNFNASRAAPDPRRRSLPRHYSVRYEITSVPSVGKFRCWDVILRVRSAKGEREKDASRIIKAWRGVRDGEPRQAALAEAHRLRDELDLSLDDMRR